MVSKKGKAAAAGAVVIFGLAGAAVALATSKKPVNGGSPPPSQLPPIGLALSVSPMKGQAPLTANFEARPSGSAPYNFTWDFGDGSPTSQIQNPSHIYQNAGSYIARCLMIDRYERRTIGIVEVVVESPGSTAPPTQPPPPPFSLRISAFPESGEAPLTVGFEAISIGVAPYTFEWSFGDGASSVFQNPSHTYQSAGVFNGSLRVVDSLSREATSLFTITVVEQPVIQPPPPSPPPTPVSLVIFATPKVGDVPLSVGYEASRSGGAYPFTYDWDFGDGSAHSPYQNPNHIYQSPGVYVTTCTVTDGVGQQAVDYETITVNQPYVAPPPPSSTTSQPAPLPTNTQLTPEGNLQLTEEAYQIYLQQQQTVITSYSATPFDLSNLKYKVGDLVLVADAIFGDFPSKIMRIYNKQYADGRYALIVQGYNQPYNGTTTSFNYVKIIGYA